MRLAVLLLLVACAGCSGDAELKARLAEAEARVAAAEAERDAAIANANAVRAKAAAGEPAYTVADLDAALAELEAIQGEHVRATHAAVAENEQLLKDRIRTYRGSHPDQAAHDAEWKRSNELIEKLKARQAEITASAAYREAVYKVERIEAALRGN